MTASPRPTAYVQVVGGILRRVDQVVLIREHRDRDGVWTLPGGGVEPGELLIEALAREVAEETGLTLTGRPVLAFTVNTTSAAFPSAVAFFFDCPDWTGDLDHASDPDGDVAAAVLVSVADAVTLLASSTAGRPETEPLLAHLAGGSRRLWDYRDELPTGRS